MSPQVMLHGGLAAHRRGRVLKEALSAVPALSLPVERSIVMMFGEEFQTAPAEERSRLVAWTRSPGRVLLLVPPFGAPPCDQPVAWRAERLDAPPRGGEGIAKLLAGEVVYRLVGQLQAPALPGATWSDLTQCIGTYRLHPASGLFVVACVPFWSLSVLDAPEELGAWFRELDALAGEVQPEPSKPVAELSPDHYGMLVFLLSDTFADETDALARLDASSIVRFSPDRARALLHSLRERGLVAGTSPTAEALELVLQSPYAPYVDALREVSR